MEEKERIVFANDPDPVPEITEDFRGWWWVGIGSHFESKEEAEQYLASWKVPETNRFGIKVTRRFQLPESMLDEKSKETLLESGIELVSHDNYGTRGWKYIVDGVRLRRIPNVRNVVYEIHGPSGVPTGVYVEYDPVGNWLYPVTEGRAFQEPEYDYDGYELWNLHGDD